MRMALVHKSKTSILSKMCQFRKDIDVKDKWNISELLLILKVKVEVESLNMHKNTMEA